MRPLKQSGARRQWREKIVPDERYALFVLLDFHPLLQDPVHVRHLKDIALSHHRHQCTVVLVGCALAVPAELQPFTAKFELPLPTPDELRALVHDVAADWGANNGRREVQTTNKALDLLVRNLAGLTATDAGRDILPGGKLVPPGGRSIESPPSYFMNPSTPTPITFEMRSGFSVFHASGRVRLEEAVSIVDAALARAREQGIRKLLADVEGFTGFTSPGLGERYFFIRRWADTVDGQVCVAVVTRPELIDPEKFGVKVAKNYGFVCDVFPTHAEAEAWLLGERS